MDLDLLQGTVSKNADAKKSHLAHSMVPRVIPMLAKSSSDYLVTFPYAYIIL